MAKAQFMIEVDFDTKNVSVTRMWDAVITKCSASKPLYSGNDLQAVGKALGDGVKEALIEHLAPKGPTVNTGFGDAMGHYATDGIGIKLACGHPYGEPGKVCALCNEIVS